VGALYLIPLSLTQSLQLSAALGAHDSRTNPVAEYLGHAGGAPAFVVIIFVMAVGKGYVSQLLRWRILVVLGEASFALYLVHQIFIGWYFMNIPSLTGISNNVLCFAYWVASLVAALLLWRFIETPLRGKIRAVLAPRRVQVSV
jgi:peptidoglycan/LPS O-acetylase OafA/YrhL